MAGKPKDAGRDTTLTLRMPRELHDRIIQAAGERSVSEEIRRRLEASFSGQPSATTAVDPKVHQFAMALAGMVQMLSRSFGDRPAFIHAALRSAVDKYLRMNSPEGEAPEAVPNPGGQYGPLYKDPVTIEDAAATAAAAGQVMAETARKP